MVNDQDFPKLTGGDKTKGGGGARQGGGLDNVEYGIYKHHYLFFLYKSEDLFSAITDCSLYVYFNV